MSAGSGTKEAAHRFKILFGLAGFKAAELHGNLTQIQRLDVSNLHFYMLSYNMGLWQYCLAFVVFSSTQFYFL